MATKACSICFALANCSEMDGKETVEEKIFSLLLCLALLSGCGGGGSGPAASKVVTVEATVQQTFDIGFILEAGNTDYKPNNLPLEFRQDGLRVRFRGKIIGTFKDPYGDQVYPLVNIVEISRLSPEPPTP